MDSDKLGQLVGELASEPGITETALPNLIVARLTEPMPRTPVVYQPSLCVVAQGRKQAYLGDSVFEYNAESYLLCSLPLPIESEIPVASGEEPLLAMVFKLDPALLGKLILEMDEFVDWSSDGPAGSAVAPCRMTANVHRAIIRLLEIVDSPIERKLLGDGLQRELLFEILRGPNGHLLREFVLRDGNSQRVARVGRMAQRHRAAVRREHALVRHVVGDDSTSLETEDLEVRPREQHAAHGRELGGGRHLATRRAPPTAPRRFEKRTCE